MSKFNFIYAEDLSHREKTVYIYLRDRADASGVCWPGIKTIARELGLSPRTVQRALADLERRQLIEKRNRRRANGSLTSDGTITYGYDVRGRLIRSTTATQQTAYRINALGQRVRKTVTPSGGGASTDTYYHYDLMGHLIGESDAAGKVTREYLWLDDTPMAVMQ